MKERLAALYRDGRLTVDKLEEALRRKWITEAEAAEIRAQKMED